MSNSCLSFDFHFYKWNPEIIQIPEVETPLFSNCFLEKAKPKQIFTFPLDYFPMTKKEADELFVTCLYVDP